jgi:hypothetical protein
MDKFDDSDSDDCIVHSSTYRHGQCLSCKRVGLVSDDSDDEDVLCSSSIMLHCEYCKNIYCCHCLERHAPRCCRRGNDPHYKSGNGMMPI